MGSIPNWSLLPPDEIGLGEWQDQETQRLIDYAVDAARNHIENPVFELEASELLAKWIGTAEWCQTIDKVQGLLLAGKHLEAGNAYRDAVAGYAELMAKGMV